VVSRNLAMVATRVQISAGALLADFVSHRSPRACGARRTPFGRAPACLPFACAHGSLGRCNLWTKWAKSPS